MDISQRKDTVMVLDMFTSTPISERTLTFCGPGDLCCLAKTCRFLSQTVEEFLTRSTTVELHALLLRFLETDSDVLALRRLQASYQFVISGSSVLQVIDRCVYPQSDLDLFLFPGTAKVVGDWFLEHGFRFRGRGEDKRTFAERVALHPLDLILTDSRNRSNYYGLPGILDVFTFHKRGRHRDETQGDPTGKDLMSVQLIVCDYTPYYTLLLFHSSKPFLHFLRRPDNMFLCSGCDERDYLGSNNHSIP